MWYNETMRKTEFANGEYYHIYNRGVDKREVFLENADYFRFLKAIKVFNQIDPTGSLRIEDRSEASRKEASLPISFLWIKLKLKRE